ncbi:MAG: hypothetical protein Q9195_005719 [Heterodermia aff. obscurata]
MLLLNTLLGVVAITSSFTAAAPTTDDKLAGRTESGINRRQDVDGEVVEAKAATDQLPIDYASLFSAQPTVTYSAVSVGAAPSNARLVATTSVSPGSNAVGSPPDSSEQGPNYVVDHILELQFAVGAFQINPRPQTSVASAFSNTFNLQGIPSQFNGFKQQVFTGRLKSQPGNPSGRTYPSDFGPALQDWLSTNQQDAYSVMDDVGKALADSNVGNFPAIKDYFTSYAQGEWQSAIDFLSTWTGTSYTSSPTAATGTTSAKTATTPAAQPATPTSTPTSAAPSAPYATGTCSFHMTYWRPMYWPDGTNPYEIEIRIKDNNKATIGWLPHTDDDNKYSWNVVSRLEDPLAVTPESQNDYVQFTLPGQSWRTDEATDQSKLPHCSVGDWDCSDDPCYRQLDCSFGCQWNGGPSSDGGQVQYPSD